MASIVERIKKVLIALFGRGDGRTSVADQDGRRDVPAPVQPVPEDDLFPAVEDETPEDTEDSPWADVNPLIGDVEHTPEEQKVTTRLEIHVRTIVAVVGTILAIWLLLKVWSILLLVFLAFLIALALLPPTARLERAGMPRIAAAGIVFLALIGVIAGFFAIIVPPLAEQGTNLANNYPDYLQQFEGFISRYPTLAQRYEELQQRTSEGGTASVPWSQLLTIGSGVVSGLTNAFFVLIMTFYLLIEGDRAYRFLARYFTPRLRHRLRMAFPEVTRVVSGYVIGQLITSVMFGVFAFITLTIVGVPEPLLLAVVAAVLDSVPIVGVPAATIPAVLLAATVSWNAALTVLIAYVIYQQLENYLLVPRVFGTTLQVSSLSILVGVLVGQQLLGVVGILIALPVTAAIPVIERVWVADVPDDVTGEVATMQSGG